MIWNRADTEEQLSTSRHSGKPKLKILQQRQVLVRMSLIFLFLGALAVRIPYLESSSMLSEVQFRSALIARGYYFELIDTVPDWRRQINVHSVQNLSGKEPPIMQLMVSFLYWIVSGESLGVARLLAATYWIVGGIFLFSISQRITSSEEAAVFATAYYLFVPIGVKISVSFLIDPFMIMLFLLSLFSIVNYYDAPVASH